jgi:hypothetical protein
MSDMILEKLIGELVGFLGKKEGIEPPQGSCTVEEVIEDKTNPEFMGTGKDSMFGDMKKYSSQ